MLRCSLLRCGAAGVCLPAACCLPLLVCAAGVLLHVCEGGGVRRVGCGHGPGVCGSGPCAAVCVGVGAVCVSAPGVPRGPRLCEGGGVCAAVCVLPGCPLGVEDAPMYRPHYIGTTKAW